MKDYFLNYPYKNFQLKSQKLDPEKMAEFYQRSASKDSLQIIHEGGFLSLAAMPAFSKDMGFQIGLLKNFIHHNEQGYQSLIGEMLEKGFDENCLIAKIPIDNQDAINALLENDFYYVCGESVFTLNLENISQIERTSFECIREAKAHDSFRIKELSQSSHVDIRYYFDRNFDRVRVSEYFAKLACDAINNEQEKVFVYERDGNVLGYITLLYNRSLTHWIGRGYGSLDYIAVDPAAQTRSIGLSLNNFALNHLKSNGVSIVSVKTMASNYRAIKLLMKNHFALTSQNLVFHWFDKRSDE